MTSTISRLTYPDCDISLPPTLAEFLSHQFETEYNKDLPFIYTKCALCRKPFCDYNLRRWNIMQPKHDKTHKTVVQYPGTQPRPAQHAPTPPRDIPNALVKQKQALRAPQSLSPRSSAGTERSHGDQCDRDKCEFALEVKTKTCAHHIGHRCFERYIIEGKTNCPCCPPGSAAEWYKPQEARRQALREFYRYTTSATKLEQGVLGDDGQEVAEAGKAPKGWGPRKKL